MAGTFPSEEEWSPDGISPTSPDAAVGSLPPPPQRPPQPPPPASAPPSDSFCVPKTDKALDNCYPGLDQIPICARGCMADAFQLQPCRSDEQACLCSHSLEIQDIAVPCTQEKCGRVQTQATINHYIDACREKGLDLQESASASSIPSPSSSTSISVSQSTDDSSSSSPAVDSAPEGLSRPTVIGIAFGAFGALLALTALAVFFFHLRRRRRGDCAKLSGRLSKEACQERQSSEPALLSDFPSPSKPLMVSSPTGRPVMSPTGRPVMSPAAPPVMSPAVPPVMSPAVPPAMSPSPDQNLLPTASPRPSSPRAFFPDPSPVLPPLPLRSPLRERTVPSIEVPLGLHYIHRESSTLPTPFSPDRPDALPSSCCPDAPGSPPPWRDDSFGGSLWNSPEGSTVGGPAADRDGRPGEQGDWESWRQNSYPATPSPERRNMI